jgi:transporter family protein
MIAKTWLAFALAATMLWGLWGFCFKLACQPFGGQPKLSQMLGLCVVQFVCMMVIGVPACVGLRALSVPLEFHRRATQFAVLSTLSVLLGTFLMMLALSRGKASIVVTLTALYPLVTLLLSQALLSERLTTPQWFGVLLAVAAMALMAQGKS